MDYPHEPLPEIPSSKRIRVHVLEVGSGIWSVDAVSINSPGVMIAKLRELKVNREVRRQACNQLAHKSVHSEAGKHLDW